MKDLVPHLFRTEYGKITSVLGAKLGLDHIEIAQDIASETFLLALETWPYRGVPPNPTAWLYQVAKNKAINYLKRNRLFAEKVVAQMKGPGQGKPDYSLDLSSGSISDSQLQMLFALCHPTLSQKAQISLALRILCGFGIDEIATAFLDQKETVSKRLFRAKNKLREEHIRIEFPGAGEIRSRLDSVLRTLYLLFNEGYYSETFEQIVRKDLCLEAIRLNYLLVGNQITAQSDSYSLLALMCFHSSRLEARKDNKGRLILYADQDESLWNQELIEKGFHFLQRASEGKTISKYYLEANIAYWHTVKEDSKDKWYSILQLYDLLVSMENSPVIALNRVYAIGKVHGYRLALEEANKLSMQNNPYYQVLLGKLYSEIDRDKAKAALRKALDLSNTASEKNNLLQQMQILCET